MSKERDAFRTISEVAGELDVQKHVLRFWEAKFPQIRPMKRGGGRRYYRPEDMELLRGIRHLLHAEGYTIKGVQKILREQGVDQVKRFSLVAAQTAAAASEKKRGRKPTRPAAGIVPAADAARKSRPIPSDSALPGVEASVRGTALSGKPLMEALIAELQACRRLLMEEKDGSEAVPAPRRARVSGRG